MRLGGFILVALLLITAGTVAWRERQPRTGERSARKVAGGDPTRGKEALARQGCMACHVVPGFPDIRTGEGPPLKGFASQIFIAGAVENTPENLIRFIQDPRSVAPNSAMPPLRVSEGVIRDLAAYLYTLR